MSRGPPKNTSAKREAHGWMSTSMLQCNHRIFLRVPVVIPLIFPKVPQSSRPESLGLPQLPPWNTPPLKNPTAMSMVLSFLDKWIISPLQVGYKSRK